MRPLIKNTLLATGGAGSIAGLTGMGVYIANHKDANKDQVEDVKSWFDSTYAYWSGMKKNWCYVHHHYCGGLDTLMDQGKSRILKLDLNLDFKNLHHEF